MVVLKGWRYAVFVGTFVGGFGLAIYPIIISPMLDSSQYKQAQRHNRAGIKQEDVQPGNMKIWTDPFDRKQS